MNPGRYLIALMSCLCLFSAPHVASAHPGIAGIEGLVVGVAEGDRITINSYGTEIRVRLYGVAAPQMARIDKVTGWYKPGQPYSDESFRALSSKVLHQKVTIDIRKTVIQPRDPQQIAIAVVYLDGRNINHEMLAEGWVWAYRRFTNRADYAHFSAIEHSARGRRTGLWLQDDPQPPWEYKPEPRLRMRHG